ncbi:MAG: SMC family ATPase [Gemmatimonadetes bacterium]|jgi:DNA repair protein SbcC/Rad50|nr:SMC family ATPase [Gemmatimonadota bacterium]MBT6147634.1 SMC family ATPase [Gemmatimonadota bacterium]MBT7861530.1 SMC family ATPase [Gemmatimonadota bacterium]
MIPVSLTLRNFLSYGDEAQTLDFTGFRVACLSGDNGHGKSALLDALTYALWGQARKGRHDRKPDEGLLRLGATHMAVEFTFDLGVSRYRVLRSYRRRPKSSTSELELQIFDADSEQFRPLTEAGSPSVTQRRIDQLLSMDYDTFTNSAFLLQGQADAFTRKSPRERKELLGRILGVERYDRLQEHARQRLSDLDRRQLQLSQRIEEADQQLATREATVAELEQVTRRLGEISQELAAAEAELAQQSERLNRSQSLRREQTWDAGLLQELEQGLEKLKLEEARLRGQTLEDDALIDQAPQIEADALERSQRLEELQSSERRRDELRLLEQQHAAAEQRIATARHELEQDLARWQERHDTARSEEKRCQLLLAQSAQIEAAWLLVTQARDQVARQREHRRAWEELARQRQQLQHRVELEQQRLQERLSLIQTQRTAIDEQLGGRPGLSEEILDAEAALAAAEQEAAMRRELAESGAMLRSQKEQRQQRRADRADELSRLDLRQTQLETSEAASCPLCGTHLDEEHQAHLDSEFSQQRAALESQLSALDSELEQMQGELVRRRSRYAELSAVDERVSQQQHRLASLRSREAALVQSEQTVVAMNEEILALQGTLQEESYGTATRQQLAATDAAMAGIDYCPERLEHAEAQATGGEAEAQVQRLEDAKRQLHEAGEQAEVSSAKIAAAQIRLSSSELAPEAFALRDNLSQQIQALDVNEDRHRQLVQRVRQLEEAPLQLERLRAARVRREQDATQLSALLQERDRQVERQREVVERQAERSALLNELAGVEEVCAQATTEVETHRRDRDAMLERRGALQTRADHLTSLAAQAEVDRQQRQQLQSKAWLHQQLVEAFGKDGIQALIIEHAIPEIEEEANAILRRLTDNRIQITIESIRDLKGGGSRETLDVKIADEIGERGYDLYSGGEAFRTDFALRLALSKVLARRSGTQLRTLIIDEGFGTQDRAGLEQLKESIHSICADFDKVIVVTHLEELKNAFPVQIEVTKHADRGSRFEIHHLA